MRKTPRWPWIKKNGRFSKTGKPFITGIFEFRPYAAKVLRRLQQVDNNVTIEEIILTPEEAQGAPLVWCGVVRTSCNGL